MANKTLLKTCSYAVMHMAVAITVAYALSRDWRIALAIGLIEPCVQTVAYFFHERAWHRFGRDKKNDPHNSVINSVTPAQSTIEKILNHDH